MNTMKPFRPPSLIAKTRPEAHGENSGQPPIKKRRVILDAPDDEVQATIDTANALKQRKPLQSFQKHTIRAPLATVHNASSSISQSSGDLNECYYNVLWRKFTTKKNKTWDGDGILCVKGGQAILSDESGKEIGRGICKGPLLSGSALSIGGREIEVDSLISKDDYLSGRKFLDQVKRPQKSLQEIDGTTKLSLKAQARHEKIAQGQKELLDTPVPSSKAARAAFKTPLLENHVQIPDKDAKVPIPRHDPTAKNALIMKRPKSIPKGKQIVDVVVDPLLSRSLREHQRAGVAFLYECVMGMKSHCGEGAILADEMGLGKTLQTIALVWTLMKQNPVYESPPVIKKALIVCPVTLVENWRLEFRKWLGNERLGVYIAENSKQRLTDFTRGRAYNVMIIGYELLIKVKDELLKCDDIGLVIADEGHRLKTQNNKAASAIKELSTERRVILSGTPIQNDLAEFFSMADFVNPGILNKYSIFKREFETPILKSRQPGATTKDLEKGEVRNTELAELTSSFILRRTAEILSKYLPVKTEYILLCRPTTVQASIYRTIIGSPMFNAALGISSSQLELINVLKKLCNSPSLLLGKDSNGKDEIKIEAAKDVPKQHLRMVASGKLRVLDALLHRIHETTDEKVVLVSNYTSTMDILARLITSLGYKYLRLDGSTPAAKRQELVTQFNRSPKTKSFVFLLSAKAGGTGLNLIGASRLILFDIDWNPATDLQAMARIHRDGQKRPCFIYRLLTQGALDEKIFQRQVSKTGLADSIVDGKSAVSGFTRDELRDLFTLDEGSDCQTHRLLSCGCGGDGSPVRSPEDAEDTMYDEGTGLEVVRLDQEDTLTSQPMPLNKVDRARQEEEFSRRNRECKDSTGRTRMLSLMQYRHFDTSVANMSDNTNHSQEDEHPDPQPPSGVVDGQLDDRVLRDIIANEPRSIGFIFAKTSVT